MVHCNLSVLLAERRLRISRVAADTKISRTTLTALAYNNCQGIQLSTLNKLCIYLDVTPAEFFTYVPIDIDVLKVSGTAENVQIWFDVRDKRRKVRIVLNGKVTIEKEQEKLRSVVLDISEKRDDSNEQHKMRQFLAKMMQRLPASFINDIEVSLFKKMLDDALDSYAQVGTHIEANYHVIWPEANQHQFAMEG